ncbi:MAG: helix-turn-helix transcriptional regulator [Myxococcales bacterium FL481]|nr:MAG: helix-turn-helix transcriptional regulator [Myxococcales bacterium FL481]
MLSRRHVGGKPRSGAIWRPGFRWHFLEALTVQRVARGECLLRKLGIDLSVGVSERGDVAATHSLDKAFQALANPTRRAVIARLGEGPATVGELAEPFEMALPSFMQHLRHLEASGLTTSSKAGRVRTVRIRPSSIRRVARWLAEQRGIWEQRLDQLDDYLQTIEEQTK